MQKFVKPPKNTCNIIIRLEVTHKPHGQFFGLPPPLLWTILQKKPYYVEIWIFGKSPPPVMSTWLMNDP